MKEPAMTRRQRVQAAARAEPVDHVPYSFWYHFLTEDPCGEEFIAAEVAFAQEYGVDVLKVMHDAPYDLPADLPVLKTPADWRRLRPTDPRAGNWGRHLQALHEIKRRLSDDRPIIDTIFGPLAYGERISEQRMFDHLRADRASVQAGLATIAETLGQVAAAYLEEGVVDGIFLAMGATSAAAMPPQQFLDDFLAHHRAVLEAASDGWLNVIHVHGANVPWDCALELPGAVINWSDRATGPTIAEARPRTDRCLWGGVDETKIGQHTPDEVGEEARDALAESGGKGFGLTNGCSVPTDCPPANLYAIAEAAMAGRG
jgi:uroporphyrinogen decarboxylase